MKSKSKEEQGIELLKNIIYETCVDCGKLTDTPKDMHIDMRFNYIEGVGQLCKKCFGKIYNKDN